MHFVLDGTRGHDDHVSNSDAPATIPVGAGDVAYLSSKHLTAMVTIS
jgi:hypothetical protein